MKTMSMNKISIIVPCYNEEKALPIFFEEIKNLSKKMDKVQFEYIFVDDGSQDNTINIMKKYSELDNRVKYLSFSRNFGKEAAIYAGMNYCNGDFVGVMDVDMQDPPELLEEMYDIIMKEDYDCVAARRKNRDGEPLIRSVLSKAFYKLINKISSADIVDGARDFRLMKKEVADSVLELKEYNRFSKGIFGWVGFKTKWISYENVERSAGETKWSLWKLLKYSINGITDFSTISLRISSWMGILFCIFSLVMMSYIAVKTLLYGNEVQGWTSLICVIFLIAGIQLFCMGILGEYLAKAYMEIKKRPQFILRESNLELEAENKRAEQKILQ